MKTLNRILLGLLLVLFGAAIAVIVMYTTIWHGYTSALERVTDDPVAAKTAELGQYIDHYFVGAYDGTELADAAAAAMVEATGDRWSYYISADDYASYLEQMGNAYVGVGITIQQQEEGDAYDIMEVSPNGPAAEAGILAGDVLVAVDGTSVRGSETADVRALVRGEEGTTVVLTVERGGAPQDFEVERRTIETIVAYGTLLEDGIGYVRIENFDSNCADYTIAAIDDLIAQGAESLLFDVRNNPGGYKAELVEVLDYLLPEGELFRMVSTAGEETVDYSEPGCIDLPMAVLVNEDSYSAAEFFAAALQEYGAAEIVGMQTCGKGYYQNTYPLSDGSAVVLSSGTYYTPNGVSLANVGVTPDLTVQIDEDSYARLYYDQLPQEEDEQLRAAIALLQE